MKRYIKAEYIPDLTERYPEGFSQYSDNEYDAYDDLDVPDYDNEVIAEMDGIVYTLETTEDSQRIVPDGLYGACARRNSMNENFWIYSGQRAQYDIPREDMEPYEDYAVRVASELNSFIALHN